MHDLAGSAFSLLADTAVTPNPPDHSVQIAVLGTLGLIVAALIGLVGVYLSSRGPKDDSAARDARVTDEELHVMLRQQASDAVRDSADCENRCREAVARAAVLERFLWHMRLDAKKIITGDEEPKNVQA